MHSHTHLFGDVAPSDPVGELKNAIAHPPNPTAEAFAAAVVAARSAYDTAASADQQADMDALFGSTVQRFASPILDIQAATKDIPRAREFPMPPDMRTFQPKFGHRNYYDLPDVDDADKTRLYRRVTSVGKVLENADALHRWEIMKIVQGLQRYPVLLDIIDPRSVEEGDYFGASVSNEVADIAAISVGSKDSGKFGDCVHAWTEFIDLGQGTLQDVPEVVRPHVRAFVNACSEAGITRPAQYVERIIYNRTTNSAGRLDRIGILADGTHVILDVKTAKSLTFNIISIGVQLMQYADAELILSEDGQQWETMVDVDKTVAVVAHIPSVPDPERGVYCDLVEIDLTLSAANMALAADVLEARRTQRKVNRGVILRSWASDESASRAAYIRDAIYSAQSRDDLLSLFNAVSDRLTPELAGLGSARFEAFDHIESATTAAEVHRLLVTYAETWDAALVNAAHRRIALLES